MLSLLVGTIFVVAGNANLDLACSEQFDTCAPNSLCFQKECRCKYGYHGDGTFSCVSDDHQICLATKNLQLKAYKSARAELPWPCRYRLTEVPVFRSYGGNCSAEIYGINSLTETGSYFTQAVEILLSWNNHSAHFGIDMNGFSSNIGVSSPWGNSKADQWKNLKFSFDFPGSYAVFRAPQCDLEINFRHYPHEESGTKVPGIAVILGPETKIKGSPASFPQSLCGVTEDDDSLYSNYQNTLGLANDDQVLLYAALTQTGLDQKTLVYHPHYKTSEPDACSTTRRLLTRCSDWKKAIRTCDVILKDRTLIHCLDPDHLLQTFGYCLETFCNGCDKVAYDRMSNLFLDCLTFETIPVQPCP